jgi:hypothetical protein
MYNALAIKFGLSIILTVPINFNKKDSSQSFIIEQIDENNEAEEEDTLKEIF